LDERRARAGSTSMEAFYKNLSIMGGFLLLYLTGAGKYSIDALCGIAPP
jgi:putative oxidoreductase